MKNHPYMPPRNKAWQGRCCYRDPESGDYCRGLETSPIHTGDFLSPGTAGVVTCPFRPCGKAVTLRDSAPVSLIEQHTISALAHPVIAGMPCPASLMEYPLTLAARVLLDQQERDMEDHIRRSGQGPKDPPSDGKMAGPSQNLRNPGRIGREPESKAPEWHLGGRVDEDVIPANEVKVGKIPSTTEGHQLGGNVSISETAARAQAAIKATEDAVLSLRNAEAQISGARGIVQELMGDGQGETLLNWMAMLNQMHSTIIIAKNTEPVASEFGRRFIANLFS